MARRHPETESVRRRRRGPRSGPPQFYVAPVGEVPTSPEDRLDVPDLLHATPLPWGDLKGSVELVRYAFEGGDAAGVFDALIEALPLAESPLRAESFEPQLYLGELISSAFALRLDKPLALDARLLKHVLSHPPKDAAHRATRQAVLAELVEKPALREALTRYYVAVRGLRTALETEAAEEPSLVRRKITVLSQLIRAVDALASMGEARSVLRRLFELGQTMKASPAWERLVRLVDLEGNVAQVDVQLSLGADGSIRGFSIVKIRERDDEGLLPGPFMRFLQQVFAFFRGHRWAENEVVVRLLDEVFSPLSEDVVALLATTGAVEVYLSALSFRDLALEKGLSVCLPTVRADPSAPRRIEGLFNPLLFLQPIAVVPCAVPIPRADALTVITGPNSGGKTRLLQAIALTQLLGQVGVFAPAREAELVEASCLFLSLVTDSDAGQVEGRLGTELSRIKQLFSELEPGGMAILDELCSGTNPEEGEAIFTTVLSLLPELRPQLFVSTHFLGLAARLMKEPPVPQLAFLQVELDPKEKPTYQFVPGVATTSLAHKVAERLGVTEKDLRALVDAKLTR